MRREQMAALGRLLADFSHEMRNHLAVIREANGLLEDLLATDEAGENSYTTSLRDCTARIEQRISVSADLCRRLSAMAHRSDTPLSFFQLNELVSELIVLLERSARSRQIALQLEPGQGIEALYNEPGLLQYVFYQLFVFFLDRMDNEQTLIVSTAQIEEGAEVRFCRAGVQQRDLSELPGALLTAVASLGARLETVKRSGEDGTDYSEFRLMVPSLPAA